VKEREKEREREPERDRERERDGDIETGIYIYIYIYISQLLLIWGNKIKRSNYIKLVCIFILQIIYPALIIPIGPEEHKDVISACLYKIY
jgi:hypothetical protein